MVETALTVQREIKETRDSLGPLERWDQLESMVFQAQRVQTTRAQLDTRGKQGGQVLRGGQALEVPRAFQVRLRILALQDLLARLAM